MSVSTQQAILTYVSKQLHLSDADTLRIARDDVGGGCYHKLTFRNSSGVVVLYLTPDHRFLAPQIYDLDVDPAASIRLGNARMQELLLSQPSPSRGRQDAPIAIVEFADFQCPYCRDLNRQLDALPEDLAAQIRVVFKHFPLPEHNWARRAATLAACAASQSPAAFWALHDLFFREQSGLNDSSIGGLASRLFARSPGADVQRFDSCVVDRAQDGVVERDIARARRLQITGTPAVFLNGERLPPAISSNGLLAERITKALSERGKSVAPDSEQDVRRQTK